MGISLFYMRVGHGNMSGMDGTMMVCPNTMGRYVANMLLDGYLNSVSILGISWGLITIYTSFFAFSLRYSFIHVYHPSLGWLYVFSSFPPRPPPQQILPLTSKPFDLRYLQRIYGSGEISGCLSFPWPWPKVTAVASISKNLLVCAIKWEPLIRSLQNMAA